MHSTNQSENSGIQAWNTITIVQCQKALATAVKILEVLKSRPEAIDNKDGGRKAPGRKPCEGAKRQ